MLPMTALDLNFGSIFYIFQRFHLLYRKNRFNVATRKFTRKNMNNAIYRSLDESFMSSKYLKMYSKMVPPLGDLMEAPLTL